MAKENIKHDNVKSKSESYSRAFWIGLALILLLFLSVVFVVLSDRLYNLASKEERAVLLTSNMKTEIKVFSAIYKNSSGDIMVTGVGGEKLIAPGTSANYTICLKNADQMAIDYSLSSEVKFQSEYQLPILVRMLGTDGTYLIGNEHEWISLEKLNTLKDKATLKKGEDAEYILQWQWAFDSNDDGYDTFLGDNVINENIGVSVSFHTYAEANTTREANDGIIISNIITDSDFTIIWILIFLALLFFLIAIREIRKDKELFKEKQIHGDEKYE